MDTCIDCKNILPRTVDRCPVCGRSTTADPAVDPFAPKAVDDDTPGWVVPGAPGPSAALEPTPVPEPPAAVEENSSARSSRDGGIHADDFLRSLDEPGSEIPTAIPQRPQRPSAIRRPAAEPQGATPFDSSMFESTRLDRERFEQEQHERRQRETQPPHQSPAAPSPTLHTSDGAPWQMSEAPPTASTPPPELPDRFDPLATEVEAAAVDEPIDEAEPFTPYAPAADGLPERAPDEIEYSATVPPPPTPTASIPAASSRIEGNLRLGPTPNHRFLVAGATVAAVAVLIAGVALAYVSTDVGHDAAPAAAVPLDTDNPPEELALVHGVPIEPLQADIRASLVDIELNGCGLSGRATGVLVGPQTVLARRTDLITDVRPQMTLSNGETVGGRVIGFSIARDLAVVRTFSEVGPFLDLAGEARIQTGSGVFVSDFADGVDAELEALEVVGRQGRNGSATTITLDTDAVSVSPVIDPNGDIVAIMDRTGRAVLADDIRSVIGRAFLANEDAEANCPPPPTTVPEAPGDDATTADGG